jgi:hypothetical protein
MTIGLRVARWRGVGGQHQHLNVSFGRRVPPHSFPNSTPSFAIRAATAYLSGMRGTPASRFFTCSYVCPVSAGLGGPDR